MVDKQFVQLIKPIANVQASIFAVAKGEDILSWLNKFDLIAAINNWTEEKQGHSTPLYLDK